MKFSGIVAEGVIGRFYNLLEQDLGGSWINKIAMLMKSTQETESYKWLGQVPQMREWIGGRLAKGLREKGLSITNKKFESTLEVDADDFRRDKTGQILIRAGELVERALAHWNGLLSDALLVGHSTVCYDGQYFFDTDHNEGASGTQLNELAATQVPALNVTTTTAPTPDEAAKAIMGMIAYMLAYKDDQGEPMNEEARSFLVMCPTPSIWTACSQAIKSNSLDTGSGTRDNPLKGQGFNLDVVLNSRLAALTEQIMLFRTDVRTGAMIMQEEEGIKLKVLGEDSDFYFDNDAFRFGTKALRNVGYGYWQYAARGTFS